MMTRAEIREYVEAFVIAVLLALFIITFIAQSFRVEGSSMEPTFHDGQRLIVDKLSYRFSSPKVGDVVVFRYPTDVNRMFIKRVIGIPGDEILIEGGIVYRNGRALVENYINGPTHGAFTRNYGPIIVPPDSYFVLGDNRLNSDDSRYPDVGFVPKNHLVGRAVFAYWPLNAIGIISVPDSLKHER
jgi:signal peptidase I